MPANKADKHRFVTIGKLKQEKYMAKETKIPEFIVYTDGGLCNQSGCLGGLGVVVINMKTDEVQEIFRGLPSGFHQEDAGGCRGKGKLQKELKTRSNRRPI